MSDFAPSVQAGTGLDPTKRVNYQLGLVLGEDEFRQDQLYHRERDHRATRALHGYGTISGLGVSFGEGKIRVAAGLAADPAGHLICVPSEYCADLDTWLTDKLDEAFETPPDVPGEVRLYVVLCYAECETDEVPVPSESCLSAEESRAASRIMESFELKIVGAPPPAAGEVAPADAPKIAAVVDAIWSALDPEAGEEPDIARAQKAIRSWVVARRPEIDDDNSCLGPSDECVLLAQVDVDVAAGSGGELSAAGAVVTQDERPVLLSTRFLQEALLRAAPADHEHALSEATDVDTSTARNGHVLLFRDGTWRTRPFAHRHPLNALRDVNAPRPDPGDVLTFDGASKEWIAAEPKGGGVSAHGDLTGLDAAADHPQYLLVDGSRDLGGDWNAAGNRITKLPPSAVDGEAITHGRPAGGDLTGSYPDPGIGSLQGHPLDAAGPEPAQALMFDGERWLPGAPRLLPFATVEAVRPRVFLVWFHLDAARNRVAIPELSPEHLLVRRETGSGSFLASVRSVVTPTGTRNLFQVEAASNSPLLRFVFRTATILLEPDGMSVEEWARTEGIWFVGEDPVSKTVTKFAVNPGAEGGEIVARDEVVLGDTAPSRTSTAIKQPAPTTTIRR